MPGTSVAATGPTLLTHLPENERSPSLRMQQKLSCRVDMSNSQESPPNFYAVSALDRLWHKRSDEQWLAAILDRPSTRYVPVWRSKNLVTDEQTPHLAELSSADLQTLGPIIESLVLLGEKAGKTYIAVELLSNGSNPPAELLNLGRLCDLKKIGPLLESEEAALLAYARAITFWHSRNRYCGVCGSATQSIAAGHIRVCSHEHCKQERFPRTDPAIIVLITAEERCLLGRQPAWPDRMYSTIAGFVEPGESLEEAVAREAMEETGVQVDSVHYHSSQPWPFPSSIMLGFTAAAAMQQIKLADQELEAAHWFTREQIEAALREKRLRLPTPISIAYRLIEDWFDSGQSGRLKHILSNLTPGK